MCIAPQLDFRRMLEDIRDLCLAAGTRTQIDPRKVDWSQKGIAW